MRAQSCSPVRFSHNHPPDTVNAMLTAAAQAAGFDHIGLYNTTCARLGDPGGGRQAPPPDRNKPSGYAMAPAKVFDNLYWVGMRPSYESQPGDPNPYVLGEDRTKAHMDVAVHCSAAGMASFRQ